MPLGTVAKKKCDGYAQKDSGELGILIQYWGCSTNGDMEPFSGSSVLDQNEMIKINCDCTADADFVVSPFSSVLL